MNSSKIVIHVAVAAIVWSMQALSFAATPEDIRTAYETGNYTAAEEMATSLTATFDESSLTNAEKAEIVYYGSMSAFERNRHIQFRQYIDEHRTKLNDLNSSQREGLLFNYAQSHINERKYAAARQAFAEYSIFAVDPENAKKAKYLELFALYHVGEDEYLRTSIGRNDNTQAEDASFQSESRNLWQEFVQLATAGLQNGVFADRPDEQRDLQNKIWRARIALGEEAALNTESESWPTEKVEQYHFAKATAYYYFQSDRRQKARDAFLDFLQQHPNSALADEAHYFASKSGFDIAKAKLNASRSFFRENPNNPQAIALRNEAMALIAEVEPELRAANADETSSLTQTQKDDLRAMAWQAETAVSAAKTPEAIEAMGEPEREQYYYSQIWAKHMLSNALAREDARGAMEEYLLRYPEAKRAAAVRLLLIRNWFDTGLDEWWETFRRERSGDLTGAQQSRDRAVQAMAQFCSEYEFNQTNGLMPTEKRTQGDLELRYWEAMMLSGQEERLSQLAQGFTEEQRIRLVYAQSQALHHSFQNDEFQALARLLLADEQVPILFKNDLTRDYLRSFSLEQNNAELAAAAQWIIQNSPPETIRWAVGKYYYGIAMAYRKPQRLDLARQAFDDVLNAGVQDSYINDHIPSHVAFWRGYVAKAENDPVALARAIQILEEEMPEGPVRDHGLSKLGDSSN